MNEVSSIKYKVSGITLEAVKELCLLEIEPEVIIPPDLNRGDLSTNVAMTVFGKLKNQEQGKKKYDSPMDLAEEIARLLNTKYEIQNTFRLVEAKEPGFINFYLNEDQIISQIGKALSFGKLKDSKKGEVILEFGDLNPFKEPHIGHLRNFSLGESIARLKESQGEKVIRANYQGDVGLHVAKALYGLLQILNIKNEISNIENETLDKKIEILSKAYAAGAKAYEEDKKARLEIISINNKIYIKDSEIFEIWLKGREWSLEYFETLYKRLGIKYDKYYFESETAPVGKKIVEENLGKVFERDDGAIIFRGEKTGLHTRVFVTTDGNPMYEAKDLALAFMKNQDFANASSIILTANEQVEYFKVLLAALSLIDNKIADKTSHISYGFVNLKEGKMSSRTGNIVSAFWLLEEVQRRLKEGFKEVQNDVLEQLVIASVKWGFLKFSRESNISFSIEESVQIEGNSGPYMLYTYARTRSLLDKGSKTQFEANSVKNLQPELLALGRLICQFETASNAATETFSPNILANYLYTLAQNFNHFYEKEKIIGSESETEKLFVTNVVSKVLENGLFLLGISAPPKI